MNELEAHWNYSMKERETNDEWWQPAWDHLFLICMRALDLYREAPKEFALWWKNHDAYEDKPVELGGETALQKAAWLHPVSGSFRRGDDYAQGLQLFMGKMLLSELVH